MKIRIWMIILALAGLCLLLYYIQLPLKRFSYLSAIDKNTTVTPILSAGETAQNGYRMAGIPDGLGILDNNNLTFTLFMHHELDADQGIKRSHGVKGAFISRWVITKPGHDKGDFKVLHGQDAIKRLYLWDNNQQQYNHRKASLARLCSADLAEPSAFLHKDSGTDARLFLSGEESDAANKSSYGRAFATIVSGPATGNSYQLPRFGQMAFENVIASPFAQRKTIAIALDDAQGKSWNTLGEIYIYIGTKQKTGNTIEKAGLNNGDLYGLAVKDMAVENLQFGLIDDQPSIEFSLAQLPDLQKDNGEELFKLTKAHNTLGITKFFRPEDGVWDPLNPNIFYFTTTGTKFLHGGQWLNPPGRLWQLTFNDINNPLAGGKISLLLKGDEGVKKLDNITITNDGKLLIQEDPGSSAALAAIWLFDLETRQLTKIAQANPGHFHPKGAAFITTNEESSGMINASHVLGEGWYLTSVQSHINFTQYGPNAIHRRKFNFDADQGDELVEDGQLVAIFIQP